MDTKPANTKKVQSHYMVQEDQQKANSSFNPYLSKLISKPTPIGYEYHQVQVPDWIPAVIGDPSLIQQSQKPNQSKKLQSIFLASQVENKQLEQYLAFAENYFEQKINDYFGQDDYFNICDLSPSSN